MNNIVFFNHKSGMGKTSLVYHIAWMLIGHKPRPFFTCCFVQPQEKHMRTQYWISALLIAAFAAPMLLPGGIQTARADRLADETAQFRAGVGRLPSPTAKDANGWTDLHYAAILNLSSLAKRLLESGAKVDARLKSDGEPYTDEWKATLRRFGEDYGSAKRYGGTPLHIAASTNAVATATLLVERGAAVNAKRNGGSTPLHFAARKNAVATATLLLERGAAVNAKTNNGWTPLHSAARKNAVATATLLIERGAAVNAKNNYGDTPLHTAAYNNAVLTATLLVERGVAVNTKNEYGLTPLHVAAYKNAVATASLLLERGVAVNAKNNDGETPLATALRFDAYEAAAVIRQHGGRK